MFILIILIVSVNNRVDSNIHINHNTNTTKNDCNPALLLPW